jgi:hypothetical protein
MSEIQERCVSQIVLNFSETYEMLQKAFDNESTSQTQNFE